MPSRGPSRKSEPRPLDAARLEAAALRYVGRYATTRAKLADYLARKIAARGWDGAEPPPVEAIVARFADQGYVDDAAFAEARGRSLALRGYGARRIGMALRAAGIEEADARPVTDGAREDGWASALAFARRRRLGPYASAPPDQDGRRRAFAAFMRAGHAPDLARRILDAASADALADDE